MWALQLAVGLPGTAATGMALGVALTRIDFSLPAPAELAIPWVVSARSGRSSLDGVASNAM
jgi:hypothetical protein